MASSETAPSEHEEEILASLGHPKGTLAILLLYMLLFVAGWIGLYFFTFLPRGAPDADSQRPAAHADVEHAPVDGEPGAGDEAGAP